MICLTAVQIHPLLSNFASVCWTACRTAAAQTMHTCYALTLVIADEVCLVFSCSFEFAQVNPVSGSKPGNKQTNDYAKPANKRTNEYLSQRTNKRMNAEQAE